MLHVVVVNGKRTCLVVELCVDGVDGVPDLGDLGDLLVPVEVRRQLQHTERDGEAGGTGWVSRRLASTH